MQRMLVGLVLLLTVAVAGLAVAVFSLHSDGDAGARSSAPGGRTALRATVDPAQVEKLERGIQALTRELDELKGENRRLAARIDAARAIGGDGPRVTVPAGEDVDSALAADGREREPDGSILVTDADEAFFLAVQQRVERRRRIEGQTRNLMRRIDRQAEKGEIHALDPPKTEQVTNILNEFVTRQDDLITTFVRDPTPAIKALTAEERRDQRAIEGERVIEETRAALERVLGPADAQMITQNTLQSLFGIRRQAPNRPFPRRG